MKKITLMLSALMISACVTIPKFDPNKPVSVEAAPLGGKKFLQNGQPVDIFDMLNKMEENPNTKELASSAKIWNGFALGLAAGGGYLIGYNLVSKEEDRNSGLTAGVVAAALGIYLGSVAMDKMDEAAKIHNKKFGKSSDFQFLPYFSVAELKYETTPVLGLRISF